MPVVHPECTESDSVSQGVLELVVPVCAHEITFMPCCDVTISTPGTNDTKCSKYTPIVPFWSKMVRYNLLGPTGRCGTYLGRLERHQVQLSSKCRMTIIEVFLKMCYVIEYYVITCNVIHIALSHVGARESKRTLVGGEQSVQFCSKLPKTTCNLDQTTISYRLSQANMSITMWQNYTVW